MDIKKIVIESICNVGAVIGTGDYQNGSDLDLNIYLPDSIMFASFIIELEDNLHIEIPYELLSSENLGSLNGFCNLLSDLI